MIRKKLDEIEVDDLKSLVINNVLERKTLEYKAELSDNSDYAKKELLADISSLANTDGGDLVLGIKESGGTLQADIGLTVANLDSEIARLENIIRDGIAPRINLEIRSIEIEKGKTVIILRTKASLEGPHRVIFKSHDKFYKRNTNGKYPIDVNELRAAFIQSGELTERIRRFRSARISDIKAADTPFLLADNSNFIAIHVLPLSAFTTSFRISSETLSAINEMKYNSLFSPFYCSGWNQRINLDGVVVYSGDNQRMGDKDPIVRTYTQLYKDGKIEAVENSIIAYRRSEDKKILPMYTIEGKTMEYISKMLQLYSVIEIQPPYFVFVSIVGIKGFTVSVPDNYWLLDTCPIVQSDLLLPEIIIDSLTDDLQRKIRPVFDMIWNAGGVSKSLNFDDEGKFKNYS
jgi:hypothetical protein